MVDVVKKRIIYAITIPPALPKRENAKKCVKAFRDRDSSIMIIIICEMIIIICEIASAATEDKEEATIEAAATEMRKLIYYFFGFH